jgi:hypothetical protein
MSRPLSTDEYRGLGIDYLVVHKAHPQAELTPVFENARFLAYKLP